MRFSVASTAIALVFALSVVLQAQEYPAWLRSQPVAPAIDSFLTPAAFTTMAPSDAVLAPFAAPAPVEEQVIVPSQDFVTPITPGICPSCPQVYGWLDALYWHRVGTGCD